MGRGKGTGRESVLRGLAEPASPRAEGSAPIPPTERLASNERDALFTFIGKKNEGKNGQPFDTRCPSYGSIPVLLNAI